MKTISVYDITYKQLNAIACELDDKIENILEDILVGLSDQTDIVSFIKWKRKGVSQE